MTREEWDKLTPDQQFAITVQLEQRLEKLIGNPREPVQGFPKNADEAAKMIQDAWDEAHK